MKLVRSARVMGAVALAGALLAGTAPTASADSTRDKQWPLQAFEAEKMVWPESEGEGITVAVVDSGVDGSHPDLRDNVLPGVDIRTGGPGNVPANNHGTAVASLIAAHGHGPGNRDGVRGLAPKAKILPIKVDREDGRYNGRDVTAGINYAIEQRVDVINVSIAGMGADLDEKKAIALAWENDIPVIAGSGNTGLRGLEMPAGLPGVVAVGAVTEAGNLWEDSTYGDGLTLTAPGADIETADLGQGYGTSSGTSTATAYVSGAVALLRAKFPDLTAGQIVNRLTQTALLPKKMGKAPNEYFGYGMIRPYSALTKEIPAGPKSGPLTAPKGAGEPGSRDTGGPGEEARKAQEELRKGSGNDSPLQGGSLYAVIALGVMGVVGCVLGVIFAIRMRRRTPPPVGGGGPPPGPPGYQGHPPTPANYPAGPPPGPPGNYPPGPPPGGPPGY